MPRHRALAPPPAIASRSAPILQVPLPTGNKYSSFAGFSHLAAGLACGLSSLAAGLAIGVVGDAGVRAVGQQDKLYVGMILSACPPSGAARARGGALCGWRGAALRAARRKLFSVPRHTHMGPRVRLLSPPAQPPPSATPAVLIFGEALGLYGLIVALILSQKGALPCRCRDARAARRGARCRG